MTLDDLQAIISEVENIDPDFEISIVNDDALGLQYLCFAAQCHTELPQHPAIVLCKGMLAIDLGWTK